MFYFKSINEIPEDIYLEAILNKITDEDDDLEGFENEEEYEDMTGATEGER